MNLGGPEDLEEEGVGGKGVWATNVGEESAGGEDVVGEGKMEASCFDCGRVFLSWQDVSIHAPTCS